MKWPREPFTVAQFLKQPTKHVTTGFPALLNHTYLTGGWDDTVQGIIPFLIIVP